MGRRALLAAGAMSTALVLTGATAARAATVSPLTLASGPSPFAACTTGLDPAGSGTNYLNAEVEPFVAVNPADTSNVIGAYQQDRWSNGGARGLVTAYSHDGGTTWNRTFAHFSKCAGGTPANGGDYDRASDPWVSIGPDGTAYQVSLSVNAAQTISAILASTSRDGGATWTEPATVKRDDSPKGFVFNDKESMTADPHIAGTAYVVWDRSRFPSDRANANAGHANAFRGDPYFSKTTDGGATWSAARDIMPQNQNIATIGNQIAVLPNGTLVDAYLFAKGSGGPHQGLQGVQRSTDGGRTWSKPIVVTDNTTSNDVDPDTGVPLRTGTDVTGSVPDIAVDPDDGTLYVVFEDNRFSGGDHNDIALSTSTDDGRTWSEPVKVNRTPVPVEAFTPAVDVRPDGTLAVTYYDIRNNTPQESTLPTDAFVVSSNDGGATWQPEARLTPASFDLTTAPFARGYFLGDYVGLANDGSAFTSFFVGTNSGNTANRTDVFSTTVTP